ncbi:head GIN domain-containing protein [Altibacter sp. HG106]|uniref:head GIN domain-containing protein n=1 Tax=Altibacter sp. HG106 TaxID=3023937 RepID=UPI0023505565|nr:head GIN domain-containing protein [Altibacter sp. HG106]MDC7996198.1 DUF2807 domain-containing protein [Altibacter sp. HG106]
MKALTKQLVVFLGVLLLGAPANAQWGWGDRVKGNGNITTRTVSTGNYDEIKGVGSIDIHLRKGSEGSISVETDENIQEYVDIEVKGNTLIVKIEKGVNVSSRHGVHVTVPFNDISEISLVGSGDIDTQDPISVEELALKIVGSGDVILDINTGKLDADITGSGDIELTGKTVDLEVKVNGSGDFHGYRLMADNVKAKVSGSGDVEVYAKNNIYARVNGSGDVYYKGNPAQKDTKVSGSGDITMQNE